MPVIADPARASETLLIYAPVPLHEKDGQLFLEDQACNGLRLWAENFAHLLVMMPLAPGDPPPNWVPLDAALGAALDRIEITALPMAYRPDRFLLRYRRVRRQMQGLIARADYLSSAIGGLFGDWGSVACLEAHRSGRAFAVWTDRVESAVMAQQTRSGSLKSRLRARLYHWPMAALERYIIRRATLGLFHGRATYDAYAPLCRAPHLVHDIHLKAADHIGADALSTKIAQADAGRLRIAYVGRAEPMKGPLDWVGVLEMLAARGIAFEATWLGAGTQHAQMVQRIADAGLGDRVHAPGHMADRARVLATLRQAHVFFFCHKTPESPRCLIEALASATPIVGYANAFAEDLVAGHGGGLFAAPGDAATLADHLARLATDRAALARLIAQARSDGAPFTDTAVFRHRAELIKRGL